MVGLPFFFFFSLLASLFCLALACSLLPCLLLALSPWSFWQLARDAMGKRSKTFLLALLSSLLCLGDTETDGRMRCVLLRKPRT
ncbi:uncharacterized protein IWZ02DRAFT_172325 [Phyllosticta citriasiana]|uniref:uncharacterized protein n=1 Tax=Phyllosticta citriasiana TaxID=595635 RepID=UPI0030FDC327